MPLIITPPLQLQQPRRFTRKLYNPNSISNFNPDPLMIHLPKSQPNIHYTDIQLPSTNLSNHISKTDVKSNNNLQEESVVPLLYLNQLIRSHEEIIRQDRILLQQK